MGLPKTAPKTGQFQKGTDARRGHGLPGRSGRKPNHFIAACSEATDAEVLPKVMAYLATGQPDDPAWRWCAEWVSEYGKRKPSQEVEHTVTLSHEERAQRVAQLLRLA